MAAAKIYTGHKEGRGYSSCVYMKANTKNALENIKRINPELGNAGTTEMLDFLTQSYIDTHQEELNTLEPESSKTSDKREAPAGGRRKSRLSLPT